MSLSETALIVIDSGFSLESIGRAARVIAVCDLVGGTSLIGGPQLSAESLSAFASDPLNHGSIVLDKLSSLLPGAPFILVRAFNADNQLSRTKWSNELAVGDGWTEAYRWAVNVCRKRGLRSVANCSFGSFTQPVDVLAWESLQLAQESGVAKPNHIVVAAAAFRQETEKVVVSAPAAFPHVIAVGLKEALPMLPQLQPGAKPNVLLTGSGPVSFRIPEVTAVVARLLMEADAGLDVQQICALLDKHPVGTLLSDQVRV